MEEYYYSCPHCFTQVSILVDLSVRDQCFIEDCERCCNPLEFRLKLSNKQEVLEFEVQSIEQ